ncbi:hypothetical protein O7634_14595 [Micromonospora sp. WMMD1120]|uniref:hypothetical protein n=1 Tax=Micromonospora sp. WMMD1120 TaxID=3016106 RepID=UPI0024175BB0|nr:hypothetical protein [Micromonospora sp. WMMD1120]MDG4807982.1 hypothetical protein [Micromonospora sp. WMMD1120]
MTSPAEPTSSDASQARQLTKPLRELAALALLGANAVFLFVGLLRWMASEDATNGAGNAFWAFIGLEAVVLPLLAVLLATHISPVLPKAKLITQAALVEYAVSALFGTLTVLIWTVGRLAQAEVLDALLGVLSRFAWMVIFAVAAWVVYTVWRAHYYVPRPKPQPGVYGQPQPGQPQSGQPQPGWPQPQGGWPAPGQSGGQQAGAWPTAGQPGGYPAPGQPGSYPSGQFPGPYAQPSPPFQAPQSAPPFPQSSPPFPQSAPPFPPSTPAPQSAPPSPATPPAPAAPAAPPFGQPPSADPTQSIPRQTADPTEVISRPAADPDDDRTQHIKPGEHPDQPG